MRRVCCYCLEPLKTIKGFENCCELCGDIIPREDRLVLPEKYVAITDTKIFVGKNLSDLYDFLSENPGRVKIFLDNQKPVNRRIFIRIYQQWNARWKMMEARDEKDQD